MKTIFKTALLLTLTIFLHGACAQSAQKIIRAEQQPKSFGDVLLLPDGSVIKTVWPTALCLADVPDEPWPNEPCVPHCEPAIYSLARVLPSGKELWAKSYVGHFDEPYEVCDADKWGFTVTTRMFAFGYFLHRSLLYFEPYDGTFFLGNPNEGAEYLHINADTGEAIGNVPSTMRVVDAEWLRAVKQKIWDDLEKKYPDKKITDNFDFKRRPKLFTAVEKAIFSQPRVAMPK